MVVKFLQDERKRFVRKANKHVSKFKMPEAREWEFSWAKESSDGKMKKECQSLLNLQKGLAGFTQTDEAKRQRLHGHQACNLTHEEASVKPTKATLRFIEQELTGDKKRDLNSQYAMLADVASDLKSMGMDSIRACWEDVFLDETTKCVDSG